MALSTAAICKSCLAILFMHFHRLPRYFLFALIVYTMSISIGVQAHQTIEIRIVDTDETREEELYTSQQSFDIQSTWHDKPNIQRRSTKNGITDFTSLSREECADQVAAAKSKNGGQMAKVVELGHDAVLPCHHCPEETETPMNWYQLVRKVGVQSGGTAFQPEEVEVDKYDDERLNRVFVNPSHQLVVKNFQPDDIGTFFCMQYSKGDDIKLKSMAFKSPGMTGTGAAGAAAAWSKVQGKDKVDMVVHLDIELPKKETLVTKSGRGYPKPAEKHVDVARNLQTLTQWEEWSKCSHCNNPGERRRRGSCFVRLLNPNHHAAPIHLDHAVRFYPSGAPCQSSIFSARDLAHIVARNPEVEIERCEVKCKKGKSAFFKLVSLKKSIMGQNKAHKVTEATFTRLVGDDVQLFCTGSKDDTPVQWSINKKELDAITLHHDSKGRMKISADHALTVKDLTQRDSGKYKCTLGKLTYAKYYIAVNPRPLPKEDWAMYMGFLGMVFVGDAVVFLFLLVVRHKQRMVQVTKNFKEKSGSRKRKVSSSTSSSVSSGSSSSTE